MLIVKGQSDEALVLDGDWFEKQRGGMPKTRLPAATFLSVDVQEVERRKKLLGGGREQLVQATLRFDGGPFVGFVTGAERRAILAGLAAARDGTAA
jgi:hypothetical protein